jgi:uncharacterized protein (TIGR03437 family)
LWQRDPFQLSGGGNGFIEGAGIDYILPYWMARYYGVISADSPVQPAAAPSNAIAPGSIASAYGANFAAVTTQAASQPLPLSLGGLTLSLLDAAGVSRSAPLLYVSPTQINFVVPDATTAGPAQVTESSTSGTQTFSATIATVTPTLFSADGTGSGAAAATTTIVQVSNSQLQATTPAFHCTASGCSSTPINLGVDTAVYLTFYGTGIRNRSSIANVTVTIGAISVPVQYAGPSPNYAGVDQINVALPLTLRGSGTVTAILTADSQTSNVVTIDIQ